jgi:hypothetical protein
VCVCVYLYVCFVLYVYLNICMRVCVYLYVRMYVRTYVYRNGCYVCMNICTMYLYIYICICMYIRRYLCVYVYIALGLTQPLKEMNTSNISMGVKAAGAYG